MNPKKRPSLDQYWDVLAELLPKLSKSDQRVALVLYRELAKGAPVSAEQLADALEVPIDGAKEILNVDPIKSLVYSDEQGRVLGFGGLATASTHHQLEVDGRELWTWCAWDSLFIPELLGKTARVESQDPANGEIVRLTVSARGVESVEPEGAVVSFLIPDAKDFKESASNLMANFCHFVFFFASRKSGEGWVADHQGTFLYSLDEASELARRLNAKMFGHALVERSQGRSVTRS